MDKNGWLKVLILEVSKCSGVIAISHAVKVKTYWKNIIFFIYRISFRLAEFPMVTA
jgi:hypothetical protein